MAIETKQRILYLASRNEHKAVELQSVLKNSSFQVRSCTDLDPNIAWDETGTTFFDNALIKAKATKALTSSCVLADDSGLEVAALNGAPGVYSSSYGGKEGDHALNNAKLLHELSGVPMQKRQARFVCCLILIDESGSLHNFYGYCDGVITEAASGTKGFGYDPYFYVPEFGRTMAELTIEEKNAISHRGKAMAQLLAYLAT